MARNFPHLSDSSFPDAGNIDVYKYANEFDYTRYDAAQMSLQLCSVPWDVGEVRVGQAIVPGLGNVVYFGSAAARDAYFTAIPDTKCYRFETRFKELHRENKIDVPVPFDVAVKYNYLVVDYNLFANDDSPVAYETQDGLRHWFYFIREVEFIAPNSTKLHLILDAWQTFIYDLDISGMVLERGHAPMQAVSADDYLADPVDNCSYLLSPDAVNDNASYIGKTAGEIVFNDATDVRAVILSTGDPQATWGTKAAETWNTPSGNTTLDGSPTYYAHSVGVGAISGHLRRISEQVPQFMQTIKAVFFVSEKLLTLGTQFVFCQSSCRPVTTKYVSNNLLTLDTSNWPYPTEYEQIAKLYTYPYSYIELTDEKGNETEIRIETLDGDVTFVSRLNLVANCLNINGYIDSTGKGNKRTIAFKNVTANSFDIKGNWYKTLMEWEIPTFGVVLESAREFDYATHFNRKQAKIAADAAKTSTDASADNAKTNAYASADAQYSNTTDAAAVSLTNAGNNAALATTNATAQQTANTTNNTADKSRMNNDVLDDNIAAAATELAANSVIAATTNNQIQAENQRATLAASSAVVTGGVSAVTSALTGNIAGAVGALVGAGTQAANATMNAAITNDLSASNASMQETNNTSMRQLTQALNNAKNQNAQTQMDSALTTANTLTSTLATNSAATTNTNAANSYELVAGGNTYTGTAVRDRATAKAIADNDNTTAKANATRTKNTAYSAVDNQIAQAALQTPFEYGEFSNAEYANTRPYGLFANIVTQDDYSICYAGDEFLRHGYMFNRQWRFDGDWNVCKYFTYWKLSDIWTSNINIPDMYVDRIRYLLLGGVTVWRLPEYIGHKTIYENMDWS